MGTGEGEMTAACCWRTLSRWRSAQAITFVVLLASGTIAFGQSHTGITASGKVVTSQQTPWMKDVIKQVRPEYPYTERVRRHQGFGRFSMTIDLKTGLVLRVTVKKSMGYAALDNAGISALRQWRFRPGTWREVELPITFAMGRSPEDAIDSVNKLQGRGRR